MAAATANGHLTPPTASDSAVVTGSSPSSKRKRGDDDDQPQADDATVPDAAVQKDILDVLSRFDTDPSFLHHAFNHDDRSASDAPSSKKTKLSDSPNSKTIASKLGHGTYASLRHLKDDAAQVSEEVVTSVSAKTEGKDGQTGRTPVEDLKRMQRVKAFQQLITEVVDKESGYETREAPHKPQIKQENDGLANGLDSQTLAAPYSKAGTVLTLFGNAPTPKQLFSSLQSAPEQQTQGHTKIELPVEEMSLPNGLTATKVMSVTADQKKGPTFADLFPPPSTLPQLQPPKAHKRSSTRDNTISWEFKEPQPRTSKRGGYTTQSLTTAEWLGYGGVDSRDGLSSPREKRKQRERALSGSVSQPPAVKESAEEALVKEEEALFRRAYASFAPSCDNSKALIPEETKNMMWWQKVGNKRFNETFAIDPELLDEQSIAAKKALEAPEAPATRNDDFSAVVEDLDNLDETEAKDIARSKTEVDRVLREVSELLETLATHQHIRNTTLIPASNTSRTPISPADQLTVAVGKPDEPAKEEIEAYDALRHELAYLIMKLPPYAVAKLDGDQLADLGVSTLIKFQSADFRGTMEEDQATRQAKYAALASAAGVASVQRSSSSSSPHYNSTSQRTPAIGQAANTRYGASYAAGKTPAPSYQRSTSATSTYGTPNTSAARSTSYGQPYARPVASQSSYGQANGSYYGQRPQQTPGGYGSYSQQYGQTPQTQSRTNYSSSQPLAQYQQRSHQAAANAASYQTNQSYSTQQYNRTTSPAKPSGYPPNTQGTPTTAARPQYPAQSAQPNQQYPGQVYAQQQQQPTSGRATPSYPSQPQTPINGFQQARPPPPVAPRAASGTPQPALAAAPPPTPPAQAQSQAGQGQVNGHNETSSNSAYPEPPSMAPAAPPPPASIAPKPGQLGPQQRLRRPVACDSCRLRKHKCVFDGAPPCENCVKYGRECSFGGPADTLRTGDRKKLRCDICKEKKMACVYDEHPPCVACRMKDADCTFNVAEAAEAAKMASSSPRVSLARQEVGAVGARTSSAIGSEVGSIGVENSGERL